MPHAYSLYEAKAKFSEVIRQVRAGKRVLISYRGKNVAEIAPLPPVESLEKRLQRLQEEGVLSPAAKPFRKWKPLARRPGALARFLESRD